MSSTPIFGPLLDDALALLRQDAPECSRKMARCLRTCPAELRIDSEDLAVVSDGDRVWRTRELADARVWVMTNSVTVVSLLDAELTLVDALRRGVLYVRASAITVCALENGLGWFLLGCARSSKTPALLDRLRAASRRNQDGRVA